MNAELGPDDIPADAPPSPARGPGARLRAAREARGLSLAAAAEQLKLKQGIIAALEADDYAALPSILFARGYLRSYAKLLALPVSEIIGTFESLGLREAPPAVPKGAILTHKRRGEHLLLKWGSVVVLGVLGALLVAWFQGEPPSVFVARQQSHEAPAAAAVIQAPAMPSEQQRDVRPETAVVPPPMDEARALPPQPAEPAGPLTLPAAEATPETSAAATTAPTAEPAQTAAPAQPAAVAPPEAATSEMSAGQSVSAAAGGSDRLVMEVSEDSWAEVTDASGERLIYRLLNAGSVAEVTGQGPLRVFLGNAPGVQMRYNGEPVTGIRISSRGTARVTLGAAASDGQ